MSQHKVKLEKVSIASPCPKKWEEMVGDERTRFCSHCQLNVYNFSAMTQAEAEAFLIKAEGRVCGRFYQRADGTMLTQDCPVGLRAIKQRVSKWTATAFSTIFGLLAIPNYLTPTYAQQKSEFNATVQRSLRRNEQPALQGVISDEFRAVIANATVTATNQQTKQAKTVRSNVVGHFQFAELPAGEYQIEITSPGFVRSSVTNLSLAESEAVTINSLLKVSALMGEFVYVTDEIPTNDIKLPATLERKKNPKS